MEMMNRHSFIQFVKEFQLYLFFLLYCCDRWGHIVALTQVLMMYQIYHTWIHLHNHSPSSSSPDSWSTFSRYHFRIYLHLYTFYCTIFTLLPPFPQHLLLPTGVSPTTEQDLFHPPVLWFCKRKNRNDRTKTMTF
jgi:hypothetical protein